MTNTEIINLLKEYKSHLLRLNSRREYDYRETRTFLNKNRALVQKILIQAGTLRAMSVAPPPMIGGYVMNNLNPLDLIFDPPYDLDVYSPLADMIEQAIGVIETDETFASNLQVEKEDGRDYDIWSLVHPSIAEVSKNRIKSGFYADAVEAACKCLNSRVRDIVQDKTGEELDGAALMRKAFSVQNPVIRIALPTSRSGQDTQQGYMEICAGVMTGIRNPKAHENETISKEDAIRKLIMISLLMYKIDQRVITD